MALVLLAVVGVPLAVPLASVLRPGAALAWQDLGRLLQLARNTLLLVGGTLALCLPCGIAGAILLYRSDLPCRRVFRFLIIMGLFVPLPLVTSAWQAALGTGGWLPLAWWTDPLPGDPDLSPSGGYWKPWAQGLGAAIWVHAAAGFPWVVWIVGQGLRGVERELEEDALLAAGPWRVLWKVTLPRCRPALFAAALWVALQTAAEITVTDMMQVRTFAEEVYAQFLVEPEDVTARAVAVALPGALLVGVLVVVAVRRWERTLPPRDLLTPPLVLFRLRRSRGPWLLVAGGAIALLLGVPVAALAWKAGLAGTPLQWSAMTTARNIGTALLEDRGILADSLGVAFAVGLTSAGLALFTCWLARESRWFESLALVLLAAAWALPGPVIGIGLKDTINGLMAAEETVGGWLGLAGPGPLRMGLYHGPSLAPLIWVTLLRTLPVALVIVWPAVRALPRELLESARLDGARPGQELVRIVWPLTAAACVTAALAAAVLSLGELSAGKLVATPGSQTFAHKIFADMHYGVTARLAGLCLVVLLLVGLGGAVVALKPAARSDFQEEPK